MRSRCECRSFSVVWIDPATAPDLAHPGARLRQMRLKEVQLRVSSIGHCLPHNGFTDRTPRASFISASLPGVVFRQYRQPSRHAGNRPSIRAVASTATALHLTQRTLEVSGTAKHFELAEWVFNELDRPATAPVSHGPNSTTYTEQLPNGKTLTEVVRVSTSRIARVQDTSWKPQTPFAPSQTLAASCPSSTGAAPSCCAGG